MFALVSMGVIIEKVMGGKAVDIQDDGSYTRFISGKKTNKILLGKPSI